MEGNRHLVFSILISILVLRAGTLGYMAIEKDSEKIPGRSTSERVNVQLKDSGIRPNYNLMIIAIKKSDGRMQFNPSYDAVIAVGKADNLKKLGWVLNPQLASP